MREISLFDEISICGERQLKNRNGNGFLFDVKVFELFCFSCFARRIRLGEVVDLDEEGQAVSRPQRGEGGMNTLLKKVLHRKIEYIICSGPCMMYRSRINYEILTTTNC